jgi:hypothetical protein
LSSSKFDYDEISKRLSRIVSPADKSHHQIEDLVPGKLSVGRSSEGNYEIFILGPEFSASSDQVRRYLKWNKSWKTPGGTVEANLLSFPPSDEYRAAVSMIAKECIRAGIETRKTEDFFSELEPIIELVLSQQRLPDTFILGLFGELFVLRQILSLKKASGVPESDPTDIWKGSERRPRDLLIDKDRKCLGVEVKTTLGPSSSHTISGLDQVEVRTYDSGRTEELYLASVGVKAAVGGQSIAGLTERILELIDDIGKGSSSIADDQQLFLDRLKAYGPVGSKGYDHPKMNAEAPFTVQYDPVFNRLYNMSDEKVKVIRRACLTKTMVDPNGISYRVVLPDSIPGSPNNPESIKDGLKRWV